MSLISVLVVLVIVGMLLYVINTFVPMDAKIKTILNIVTVIIVLIWLLQESGVLGPLGTIRIR